ncbi:MAG: hypothetical protein A3B68_09780 [Candidatus Melainabacteria bacterium RIFCSPHIGHO2_02_FULL_34_12]|nr:MAG: hypothetical protein A3B68_09780 [Candidatus Melainabacteria bacterium RIFCSPHIGHO2_02_FULL_34_12]
MIGYGVISYKNSDKKPKAVGYGYIDLRKYPCTAERLLQLYRDMKELIKHYKPLSIAIENVYLFKNAKTFTPVIQSKGVIILAAAEAYINIYEYTPLQIKQTISGYGKADKMLVQKLIQTSLGINLEISPDDTSDALAVALCHMRHLL